jgi:hypothetical protein
MRILTLKYKKYWVTGMLHLGCFPLWGREEVPLIVFLKEDFLQR